MKPGISLNQSVYISLLIIPDSRISEILSSKSRRGLSQICVGTWNFLRLFLILAAPPQWRRLRFFVSTEITEKQNTRTGTGTEKSDSPQPQRTHERHPSEHHRGTVCFLRPNRPNTQDPHTSRNMRHHSQYFTAAPLN